jgi:hypothetical protein
MGVDVQLTVVRIGCVGVAVAEGHRHILHMALGDAPLDSKLIRHAKVTRSIRQSDPLFKFHV